MRAGAGRAELGGQTSQRRDPSSSSSFGRGCPAERSRRGGGAGGGRRGDRRGCCGHRDRAESSAQRPGWRWQPRVNTQPVAPAGGGGSGGPRSLPTGPQGWKPAGRQSALARLGRSWQPRLLPGASSRLSPPSEAPSSPAPHLPLATPAASLRAALPQPSRETGGRGAEQRGACLRGRD